MATFGYHTTSDEAAAALKASITGKTILVTGVSPNSLGWDTARAILTQKPAKLLIASRAAEKLQEVIKSLEIPQGTAVQPILLDLSSLEATRKAAAEVNSSVNVLDAVICTAGVMATPVFERSKDGIEMQFAVNHLGHFVFINELIDKMLASENPAVVTYSSEAQQRANLSFLDDLSYNGGKSYEKWTAYSNAKACDVLLAVGLTQKYGKRGLRSFSVDPGIILTTSLTRSVPAEDYKALGWVDENGNFNTSIKTKTAAEGSSTGIIAAFDRRLSNSDGYYLADGVLTTEALLPGAVDAAQAEKLWRISETLAN